MPGDRQKTSCLLPRDFPGYIGQPLLQVRSLEEALGSCEQHLTGFTPVLTSSTFFNSHALIVGSDLEQGSTMAPPESTGWR